MTEPTPNDKPKATMVLPHLRKGLTYTFNDYDYDGKPQWLIHDAGRNKFFIISWPDYEMLMRWHLSDPEDLIYAVNNETTLHVEMQDLENLVRFLAHNYLLEQSGKAIIKATKDQQMFKDDNIFHWLVSHYLFFRVPLWHPDKFLTKTKRFGDFLFSKRLFYVMMFLGFVAVFQITARWEEFVGTFHTMISWRGLFFYFIAFTLVKILHEAGHAYKCKEYNIPVPSCGLAFLVFWPVLYTDTTLSWTLNSKKRMKIALAGIQIETYVTIIAALIWCNTNNLTISAICYVTITINWLSSLLINVSPFMRFDGYYVLSDFMKMPNLQYRAFALTRWQMRKFLFGWDDPPPEVFSRKIHNFLIIYSVVTWIYRLTLYLGIALLVYYMFFKVLGIILFIIEVYYFILDPFVREFYLWYTSREKFKFNINTKVTTLIALMIVGMFFLPFGQTVDLPATMHYSHQFLFSPEEGTLEKPLPKPGSKILANQPITEINSPLLDYSLQAVRLEYNKLQAEVRRSSVDEKYANDKQALLSNLDKKKSEYNKLLEIQKRLIISVPFNGVLIDVATELNTGSYVSKNEWLGDVINTGIVEIEGYVTQIDLGLLKPGQSGTFYPEDLSEPKVPVNLILVEPLNPTALMCSYADKLNQNQKKRNRDIIETPCYNSSEYGGQIATYVTEKGEFVPVDSVHRVLFKSPEKLKLAYIQRGHVIVDTQAHSIAYRFFYKLKRILIQEKDF